MRQKKDRCMREGGAEVKEKKKTLRQVSKGKGGDVTGAREGQATKLGGVAVFFLIGRPIGTEGEGRLLPGGLASDRRVAIKATQFILAAVSVTSGDGLVAFRRRDKGPGGAASAVISQSYQSRPGVKPPPQIVRATSSFCAGIVGL